MAMPSSFRDRDQAKFVQSPTRADGSAIEIAGQLTPPDFSPPANSTCYTYTTGTSGIYYTEIYRFYESGTPAAPVNLLKTITLYYTDSKFKNEFGGAVS